MLDFTGGSGITTLGNYSNVTINGPNAFIASGGATSSNSALSTLETVASDFTLLNGASVVTAGALAVGEENESAGNIEVANGASLTVNGALTLNSALVSGPLHFVGSTLTIGTSTDTVGTFVTVGSLFGGGGTVNGNLATGAHGTLKIESGQGWFVTLSGGGMLELVAPVTGGTVDFAGVGTVKLDSATLADSSLADFQNFDSGDTIDIAALPYSSLYQPVWLGPSTLAIEYTPTDQVQVTFTLTDSAHDFGYTIQNDGAGGTSLSVSDVSTSPEDFNNDGTSDLLLQNGAALADWTIQNAAIQAGYSIGSLTSGWNLAAIGDFNGDGTTDLLLQNGSTLADWLIQDGVYAGGTSVTTLPQGWSIGGIGNFNGDGTSDLLLQNGANLAEWTIENNEVQSTHSVGTLPDGWSVIGTGDFTGNGTTDLLLQDGA